ncbi:MAG: hypothetical protein AABW82_01655 [Nanoarchaeota archaeon]
MPSFERNFWNPNFYARKAFTAEGLEMHIWELESIRSKSWSEGSNSLYYNRIVADFKVEYYRLTGREFKG